MKKASELTLDEITLRELLALFCADIDIFLLKDEAQENDLDKSYTKEEIRAQLHKSMNKMLNLSSDMPLVYDIPIFPTLLDVAFSEMGFSQKEIKEAKESAKKDS